MTNLAIDIGNTLIKTGYFTNNNLLEKKTYQAEHIEWAAVVKPNCNVIVIASGNLDETLTQTLKTLNPSICFLSYKTPVPIEIAYKTPHTLGLDRIAGTIGAREMCSEENILVIDIGTAITYDIVCRNVFIGGNISPGLSLRYKSLNNFTSRLPLGTIPEKPVLTGTSTEEAVNSGVFNGMLYEITEAINVFEQKYKNLKIFITGGDAPFFVNKIKSAIFAEPNLVLIGLNRILTHLNVY